MQTVNTIPGKTYAVECEGEVIITNTETGAIAAQGDGSGQVLFTACGNSYDVSDDTAKVVALFKLAPRLKLTLLQGVAGGLLPRGFTELEYLETSGTQHILIADLFSTNSDAARIVFNASDSLDGTQVLFGSRRKWRERALSVSLDKTSSSYAQFGAQAQIFDFSQLFNTKSEIVISQSGCLVNSERVASFSNEVFTSTSPYYLFTTTNDGTIDSRKMIGKCYAFSIKRSGKMLLNFVPALNADGEAGMFDTVSKQFFTNAGSGAFGYRIKRTGETSAPMSLRDPWRVAPSGVYARPSGENELEIIADTDDATGDGWEWFSNTAEAYEHFGIVIQEDFN